MTDSNLDTIDYDRELCRIYGKDDDPVDNGDPTTECEYWGINLSNELLPSN
jgi:hypothetical protein